MLVLWASSMCGAQVREVEDGADANAVTQPAEQGEGPKVTVRAVHLERDAEKLAAEFANDITQRNHQTRDGLDLLIDLGDMAVLPLDSDALQIETFLDDTYRDLADPDRVRDGGYSYRQPSRAVESRDGHLIHASISATSPLAADAGRVFVRGSVAANAGVGEAKVERLELVREVGKVSKIGPFEVRLQGITAENDRLSFAFSIKDDDGRISRTRILNDSGEAIHIGGIMHTQRAGSREVRATVPADAPEVVLELTYFDAIRPVRIPFEAQVNLGTASAGPIAEAKEEAAPAQPNLARPWPPTAVVPPASANRDAFRPGEPDPVEVATVEGATVDLFALSIGRPTADESPSVLWSTPAADELYAQGYVIARMLLSTPGRGILDIPEDAVRITKFEDDLGGAIDEPYDAVVTPTIFNARTRSGDVSDDGYQARLDVSLPTAPTPGAKSVTVGGVVKATVTKGEEVVTTEEPVRLRDGGPIQLAGYDITIEAVMNTPPGIDRRYPALQASVTMSGPLGNVRQLELLDAETQIPLHTVHLHDARFPGNAQGGRRSFGVSLRSEPPEHVLLRVTRFDETEEVEIPFEWTTGVGL